MRKSGSLGRSCRGSSLAVLVAFVLSSFGSPARADAVVGATNGSFEVTADGQGSFSAQIEVPPGIQGLSPQLSIAYSSDAGTGLLGLGGQLSGISAITRCGATIAQDGFAGGVNHDSNDRFCLGGDRLILVAGSQGAAGAEYRTEIDSFQKVTALGASGNGPQSFTVQTKGGGVMYFGSTADSRVEHPQTGTVHRWWISRLEDVNGNYIEYEYADSTSSALGFPEIERVPFEIRYGGNAGQSVSPHLKVAFEYEPRADIVRAFSNGMAFKVTQRLASIKTYAGGSLVRDYRLGYDVSPDTEQSRLLSLTECAYDGSCYNPTTFNWQSPGKSWVNDYAFGAPDDLYDPQGGSRGVLVDLDNDGRTDWVTAVVESGGATQLGAWLGSDSGWTPAGALQPPAALFDYSSVGDGVGIGDLADLDGDGRVDWVVSYADASGGYTETWLSSGSGWNVSTAYRLPYVMSQADAQPAGAVFGQLVDLNGDALPDYVVATRDHAGTVHQNAWLNTGSGWATASGFMPPSLLYDYSTNDNGVQRGRIFDVNGDGLPDWVIAVRRGDGTTSLSTWLNTGSGWTAAPGYSLPSVLISYQGDDEGRGLGSLADLNGDGLVDIALAYELAGASTTAAYLNTGAGWLAAGDYTPPALAVRYLADGSADALGSFIDLTGDGLADFVQAYETSSGAQTHAVWRNTNPGWVRDDGHALPAALVEHVAGGASLPAGATGDVNGDGFTDVVLSREGGATQTFIAAAADSSPIQPQAIDGVVNGLGFETRVEYAPTSQDGFYAAGAPGDYPDIAKNGISWLVSAVEASDGVGGYSRVEHRYGGAKVNLVGRGSLGFAWREVYDTRTGITMRSEFEQAFPYIGQLKYSSKTHGGTLIYESVQSHDFLSLNSGKTVFPYGAAKTVDTWELDGMHVATVQTTSAYDSHGNNTQTSSTTSDVTGTYTKTVENAYGDDTGNWILGELTSTTTTSSAPGTPTITRRTEYQSDALGRITQQVVEPLHSQAVTTAFQYDGFGNTVQTTVSAADIATRTSSVTYSAD
ncbi:MAG TPA: FG-GAP-like repeat-containing protein, partial [Arenicellales bacterium]|nr:FG-GAP-like repeat-containing protein [Arenicellales bacterium]